MLCLNGMLTTVALLCYATYPDMKDATTRYLDYYKHNCYSKPCELEDENDTPEFDFLQGIFVFTPSNCIARYQSKNFTHYVTYGRPKFRSMQHYSSYCNSPSATRYSSIASNDDMRVLGVNFVLNRY